MTAGPALLVGAAAVAVRFARSTGEERLQLKWFMMAALLVVAAIIPLALAPQVSLSLDTVCQDLAHVVQTATAEALGDEPADLAYRVGRSPR